MSYNPTRWWDAGTGVAVTGALVNTWTDRIAGEVVTGTGVARPTLVPASSYYNNLPAIDFGVAGGVEMTSDPSSLAALVFAGVPATIYVVARRGTFFVGPSIDFFFSLGTLTNTNNEYALGTLNTGTTNLDRIELNGGAWGSGTDWGTAPHFYTSQITSAGLIRSWLDGVVSVSPTLAGSGLPAVMNYLLMGGRRYAGSSGCDWLGEIVQIIVYLTAHTDAQRLPIEAAIKRKYLLPLPTIEEKFKSLLQTKGIYAFEARNNTNDGTNVQTFVDLIDPTRTMTLSGPVTPKPVTSAAFGGALVCNIPYGAYALCNRPPSEFRVMHDGTGIEVRRVFSPLTNGLQILSATRGAVGFVTFIGGGDISTAVSNSTPTELIPGNSTITGGALATNVVSTHFRYSSTTTPNFTHHTSNGAADVTGAQAAAPYAGDPSKTLSMFSDGASGAAFTGSWFGEYAFRSLTTAERTIVDQYTTAMTGVVP